jgi:hypothetical protein
MILEDCVLLEAMTIYPMDDGGFLLTSKDNK